MANNPCNVLLFAALLPCCENGKCKYGHTECTPEHIEQARKYYRTHGIGDDGVGLDRLRGTAFEEPVAHLLDIFPGSRLVGFGPEQKPKERRHERKK